VFFQLAFGSDIENIVAISQCSMPTLASRVRQSHIHYSCTFSALVRIRNRIMTNLTSPEFDREGLGGANSMRVFDSEFTQA